MVLKGILNLEVHSLKEKANLNRNFNGNYAGRSHCGILVTTGDHSLISYYVGCK
jgi:hypothetical protein